MKKCFLAVVFPLVLSSCATPTMSLSDTQKYKDLDIYTFLKVRFVDTENNQFFDKVDSGLDSITSALEPISSEASREKQAKIKQKEDYEKRTTGLMEDGKTVIFEAAFTEMNDKQLYRPKTEIQNYCITEGGELQTLYKNNNNFVVMALKSPQSIYQEFMSSNVSVFPGDINSGLNIYSRSMVAAAATEQYEYNIKHYNSGDARAYGQAADRGEFGTFQCVNISTKQPMWNVIISPFTYTPTGKDYSATLKIIMLPSKLI